jgi:hypothetical protein
MAVIAIACGMLLFAAPPQLGEARRAVKSLKYSAALPLLAAAKAAKDNDRASMLEILWLQGFVSSTLGRRDDARTAFRALLMLEPEFKPPNEPSPKVMTPFYEAKTWAADNGPLRLVLEEPRMAPAGPAAVSARVENDALQLSRAIRFHVRVPGGAWSEQRVGVAGATATFEPPGPRDVWVELLGENGATLEMVGSADAPRHFEAPAPQAERAPQVEPVAAPATPPEAVVQEGGEANRPTAMRWVGIGAAAAGVVAAGLGALFGSFARQAAQQLIDLGASHMTTPVTELSQVDAFALNARVQQDSLVANALFVTAGVLAVAAVVLFLLGHS